MDPQNLNLTATAFTTVILGILAWVLPLHAYLHIYAVLIRFAVVVRAVITRYKIYFSTIRKQAISDLFFGNLGNSKDLLCRLHRIIPV